MKSILVELDERIKELPAKQLYVFLNIKGEVKESYTYEEFLYRTNDIASHISTYNLNAGDRVLLAYPAGLEMICAFFSCVRLGLIPVPVYPPTTRDFKASIQKMDFIAKDCEAAAILTDKTYYLSVKINLENLGTNQIQINSKYLSKLEWIISDDSATSGDANFKQVHSDLLFLQYTSGSTNNPKGVMVTHENMLDNCNNAVDFVPIGVSWLPQYHDMGLIGYYILFALKGGTTYGFSPTDFILRPSLWLETISKYKGTATSAPNFAYEYCLSPGKISEETLAQLDLSSLRYTMNAAEPINVKIHSDFKKKFEPYGLDPDSFFAAYGLAENTLVVTNYGRVSNSFDAEMLKKNKVIETNANTKEHSKRLIMSCGRVLGDTTVKIVDVTKELKEVEALCVGEIWISGSSKCLGYWNKTQLTKEKFQAKLVENDDEIEWMRSGDLGFFYENELYICGRLKDMIIIRGLNYYPHDIEHLVEQNPLVRKSCIVAFSESNNGKEQLILLVGIKNRKKIPDAQELNAKISHYFGISASTIAFVLARNISKTTSGKIKRYENKNRYLNNDLEIIDQTNFDTEIVFKSEDIDEKETNPNEAIVNYKILFSNYKLTGHEIEPLGKAGLDSLKLAEFGYDLKTFVKQKGYDDLSRDIDLRIIQKIAVSDLFSVLEGLETSTSLSKFKFRQAFQKIHKEYAKAESKLMLSDSSCNVQFKTQTESATKATSEGDIFLTGGTGFFGPFLIKSLLEQNEGTIYVLVRAKDEKKALIRLREAFSLLAYSEQFQEIFNQRVKPVCGDLSKSKLGISTKNWDFLCKNIAIIYHNGALVNYVLDYESMRNSNVGGTNEVIRLCMESKEKVLNYISTTFIFGWSTKDTLFESDSNEQMELLDFGYSQSKWVSEKVVKDAMEKGLNARIFRPALISPSIEGDGYNVDIAMRLLVFMLKHKIGTTAKNQVSFTPADIGANNIIAISNLPDSIGKTFHVTCDEYSNMVDITTILSRLNGKQFQNYPLLDFVPELVNRCKKEDLLFPLLNFLVRSVDNISSMEFKRYDNSNYMKYRNQSDWGIQDSSLEDVVKGIFKFMEKQNLVETTTAV